MSDRKRKLSSEIQTIFCAIQSALIDIKPRLNGSKRSTGSVLADELHNIAAQAESFTQQRLKSSKDWSSCTAVLDREGVNLWNISGSVRDIGDDASRALFAGLRLAGFRLIEAGMEQKPSIETLVHVLQLASKASASLSESGRNDVAASILSCAAKYEEALRVTDDVKAVHQSAKARAVVQYYTTRMEVAWREGNDGVADFMLQKITDNEQHLRLLPPRDREYLTARLLEIGKSLLRKPLEGTSAADKGRAQESIKWMQRAFTVVEKSEDSGSFSLELKQSILRSLARAYFISSTHDPANLDRAEASLEELISTIDASVDRKYQKSAGYQQLRWMRVAILKRRKAAGHLLLAAFKSIIDHMAFSETNVTDILQEMRTLVHDHVLVTAVHQHVLLKALKAEAETGLPHIDRLLLSLLFHCFRDDSHARAMQEIDAALQCLSSAEHILPKLPTAACLTLLWQFGERKYHAKHWAEAADWFLIGTHKVFASMAHTSKAKCFRKAALCYISQQEYSRASTVLHRCPGDEASTHYVMMLAAVRQGLEDQAITAVQDMVKATDFDKKMLLLATQLANDSAMKTLLLSVLQALLDTLQVRQDAEIDVETVSLIRCIIRLALSLMAEPGSDRIALLRTLVHQFNIARTLINGFHAAKRASLVAKDLSWLWRTAYNCAVQGCAEWGGSEGLISNLFELSKQLLESYLDSMLADVDAELYMYLANASFAWIAGKVFALRHRFAGDGAPQPQSLDLVAIADDIQSCKSLIQDIIDKNHLQDKEDKHRAQSFIQVIRIFQVEVLCLMQAWDPVLHAVEEAVHCDEVALETFEAIADILWVEKDCPVGVLFRALEAILHASLDQTSLSVKKFSRWLRAICTILLSRNAPSDRPKAIGYVEQAVAVMEQHSECQQDEDDMIYPMDERQWLLGTAYNTGIECLHASLLDEAKRWFESSTMICRFVPDSESRAKKISETYTHLLARYASRSTV